MAASEKRSAKDVPAEEPPKKVSPFLKAFVLFHLFAITVWALPQPPEKIMSGEIAPSGSDHLLLYNFKEVKPSKPIQAYLLTTGFWQYWDMFAPNPSSSDFYGDAIVRYKDGKTEKIWEYPRIEKLGLVDKFFYERHRKYFERVRSTNFNYVWATFAQRAAEQMDTMPGNPPVYVALRRNMIAIQPPGKKQWDAYQKEIFYEYQVDQKQLEEARKRR